MASTGSCVTSTARRGTPRACRGGPAGAGRARVTSSDEVGSSSRSSRGSRDQGACECDALGLASREFSGRGVVRAGQAVRARRGARLPRARAVSFGRAARPQRERHVLDRRQMREQPQVLEHDADRAVSRRGCPAEVVAVQFDAARGFVGQPRERMHHGRLPARRWGLGAPPWCRPRLRTSPAHLEERPRRNRMSTRRVIAEQPLAQHDEHDQRKRPRGCSERRTAPPGIGFACLVDGEGQGLRASRQGCRRT